MPSHREVARARGLDISIIPSDSPAYIFIERIIALTAAKDGNLLPSLDPQDFVCDITVRTTPQLTSPHVSFGLEELVASIQHVPTVSVTIPRLPTVTTDVGPVIGRLGLALEVYNSLSDGDKARAVHLAPANAVPVEAATYAEKFGPERDTVLATLCVLLMLSSDIAGVQ